MSEVTTGILIVKLLTLLLFLMWTYCGFVVLFRSIYIRLHCLLLSPS